MSVNVDNYHDKFQIIISLVKAVETSKLWFYNQNMTNISQINITFCLLEMHI